MPTFKFKCEVNFGGCFFYDKALDALNYLFLEIISDGGIFGLMKSKPYSKARNI